MNSVPEAVQSAMLSLLERTEKFFLSSYPQPILEQFGFAVNSKGKGRARWNALTTKTSVEKSTIHYTLRTLQSNKRRSLSPLQRRIMSLDLKQSGILKKLKSMMAVHSEYLQSAMEMMRQIPSRLDLEESMLELWRRSTSKYHVPPQSIMLMHDAMESLSMIITEEAAQCTVTGDMMDLFSSILIVLHLSVQPEADRSDLNIEYLRSEWNESLNAAIQIVVSSIEQKLNSDQCAEWTQCIRFVDTLGRTLSSLQKLGSTVTAKQDLIGCCAGALSKDWALGEEGNGKMSRMLMDSVLIWCREQQQIGEWLFERICTSLESLENVELKVDEHRAVWWQCKTLELLLGSKKMSSEWWSITKSDRILKAMQHFSALLSTFGLRQTLKSKEMEKAKHSILCELACGAVAVLHALSVQDVANLKEDERFPMLLECLESILDAFCSKTHFYNLSVIRTVNTLSDEPLGHWKRDKFRSWTRMEDWSWTPHRLFVAVSRLLIHFFFEFRRPLRTYSARYYLMIRRLIRITFYRIRQCDKEGIATALCFVEELSRMLTIIMKKKPEPPGSEERVYRLIEVYLNGKHLLMVHCDVMLMEFVHFMRQYPVPSILRRVLMPPIFCILDHLMVTNMKGTGTCMDQVLLMAAGRSKQTLKDIHTEYEQHIALQDEQLKAGNVKFPENDMEVDSDCVEDLDTDS